MKNLPRPFGPSQFVGFLLLLVGGATAAQATNFDWIPSKGDGLYSDPDNWFPDDGSSAKGPPKAGDTAGFLPRTVSFKPGDTSESAVTGGGDVTFDLSGGGYTISGALTFGNNDSLGIIGGANTLTAGSIEFSSGNQLVAVNGTTVSAGSISGHDVVADGGVFNVSGLTQAVIDVQDGGSFSTKSVNSPAITLIGDGAHFSVAGDLATASIDVSGSGSVARAGTAKTPGVITLEKGGALEVSGDLVIGYIPGGTNLGNFNIMSGGSLSSATAEVLGVGGVLTLDGSGSGWVVTGLLQTGTVANGTVSLTAQNGGAVSVGSMDLGVAATSGSVFVFDGPDALTVTQGPLRVGVGGDGVLSLIDSYTTIGGSAPVQIGVNPGSNGTLGVNGASTTFNLGGTAFQVGVGGQGAMSVSGGAVVNTGPVTVAVQATAGTTDNPSSLYVDGASSRLTINGSLTVGKAGGTGSAGVSGGVLVAQSLLLGASGSFDVTQGRAVIGSGTAPGEGIMRVAGGGVLSGKGRQDGTTVVNTSVTGNVVIGTGGKFLPGADPNVFFIQGDCDLSGGGAGGGETDFELGGMGTAGVNYDQLIVSGKATLGGTLRLVLLPGYVPKVGDQFSLVKAGSVVGGFAQVIAPGLTVNPVPGAGKLSVTVTAVAAMDAPAVTSVTTAAGVVGASFSYQITATNTPTGYTAAGLPGGLALDPATGLITGTPTAAGTYQVALSATNVAGTGTATLTLTVAAASANGAPTVTSAPSATAQVGTAFSYQIAATGSPTRFGVKGLPAFLSVDATSGLLTGTPKAPGIYTLTLQAANAKGTGTAALTLTVTAATPTVTIQAAGDGMAVEGGEKGKVFVERTGDTSAPLTVFYKAKGSAKAGVDFKMLSGSVTIPAGSSKAKVKIKPIDNATVDGTRKLKLRLLPASDGSYLLGDPAVAKIKFIDND